jgi:hypothetical protein
VDASSRENIEASLASFAAAKRIGKNSTDTLKWLAGCHRRWMMVFDNADDPEIELHDFFPRSIESDILITTRHRDVVRLAQGPNSDYNLSGMGPDEARQLLVKAARSDESTLSDEEMEAIGSLIQVYCVLWLHFVHWLIWTMYM